jgi:Flp pilus assembly pilin Flp
MLKSHRNGSTAKRRRSLGQGMTEYIIIVALIALAAIAVYSLFGKTVRNQVGGMAQDLAGVENTGTGQAATAAGEATTAADTDKGLANYSEGNVAGGN